MVDCKRCNKPHPEKTALCRKCAFTLYSQRIKMKERSFDEMWHRKAVKHGR